MITRYDVGIMALNKVDESAVEKIILSLGDVAPDFVDYLIESFGDNYSRPYLSIKERELIAIASLVSLGHLDRIDSHVHGAKNSGASMNQIIEVIMQMSYFSGFPAAVNGLLALKKTMQDKEVESR